MDARLRQLGARYTADRPSLTWIPSSYPFSYAMFPLRWFSPQYTVMNWQLQIVGRPGFRCAGNLVVCKSGSMGGWGLSETMQDVKGDFEGLMAFFAGYRLDDRVGAMWYWICDPLFVPR